MILVPDTEHEMDRLARDVADAALKLDRENRDADPSRWRTESSMSPDRYRLHVTVMRYEQAGGGKGDGKPLNENDRLRLLVRQYQDDRDKAQRDATEARYEAEEEKGKRIDAEAARDEALEAVRGYVRECRDAAVLGPGRCRVDRYYAKLEQLA